MISFDPHTTTPHNSLVWGPSSTMKWLWDLAWVTSLSALSLYLCNVANSLTRVCASPPVPLPQKGCEDRREKTCECTFYTEKLPDSELFFLLIFGWQLNHCLDEDAGAVTTHQEWHGHTVVPLHCLQLEPSGDWEWRLREWRERENHWETSSGNDNNAMSSVMS